MTMGVPDCCGARRGNYQRNFPQVRQNVDPLGQIHPHCFRGWQTPTHTCLTRRYRIFHGFQACTLPPQEEPNLGSTDHWDLAQDGLLDGRPTDRDLSFPPDPAFGWLNQPGTPTQETTKPTPKVFLP